VENVRQGPLCKPDAAGTGVGVTRVNAKVEAAKMKQATELIG